MIFLIQEIQSERLFKREPEYEALENKRLGNPVLLEKYEQLQKKWNDTCRRLEDYQKRFIIDLKISESFKSTQPET